MELEIGQKLLVLRYNTKVEPECIKLHQNVIQQTGYCWFGKIGKIPSAWMLEAVFAEKAPAILLYNRSGTFLSTLEDFSYETQQEGIPEYYINQLYNNGVFPESYFKLTSIEKTNTSILEHLFVFSSGKNMHETLNGRAMSSFFFVGYEQTKDSIDKKGISDRFKKKNESSICKYVKNGVCRNRNSINYQYKCERPSVCAKRSV